MSRHFRSVWGIAQTAGAGPSTRPFIYPRATPIVSARRTAFSWNDLMSGYGRRRRADPEPEKPAEDSASSVPAVTKPAEETNIERGIFEDIVEEEKQIEAERKSIWRSHTRSSGIHRMSPRKLKLLANQIAGLPIDEAIVQMQFSDKAASRWIKSTLVEARNQAVDQKNLNLSKLIISEAFVNKGKYGPKKVDIKGRGRFGIRRRPYSRIVFTLAEGKTKQEQQELKMKKTVDRLARSSGFIRDDAKLRRKTMSDWAW